MLIDAECIPSIIEQLRPNDFYAEENRNIFETIYSMFNNALRIDAVTVLEQLKTQGVYDDAGGRAYLMQLMQVTPTAANVEEYTQIVRDKSMLRAVQTAGEEIRELATCGNGTASEIAEQAERIVYNVRQGREIKGMNHIQSVILDLYAQIDERIKSGGLGGISTGFPDLDRLLTGLNKSDLILIAARPGMGKTAFALNIAMNAAKASNKGVAVFQLEMSKTQIASRFLSSEAMVDSQKIKTGNLDAEDWKRIVRATRVLSETKIYVDDNPAITAAEIKAKCRRLGDDLGLIVIDYIQLMQSGSRTENRVQEVAEISRSLKIMAKELDVPVICLSQLSRAVEQRSDKRPILSDLRESGAIEQDADIVMFIYRDDYYNEDSDTPNVAEIIIAKNRHGSTGTVNLQWLGQYTTFYAQEKIHKE